MCVPCDVTSDEDIRHAFDTIGQSWDRLDAMVHAIAFAKKEDLEVSYVETSRDGYALAQDISAYSLVTTANAARPLMKEGGSIITMTYMGAERVIPNYNVMGVAKAALETSVKYLAYDLGQIISGSMPYSRVRFGLWPPKGSRISTRCFT